MVEQNYEERLERLYSNLNHKLEIYREGKRRWVPFLSMDFNVVSEFIRPKENRLSDIIKCLLEANGPHGQGSKFLAAFLKRLFKENQTKRADELSGKGIQVKREVPTYYNDENQRRRIDITIDSKNFIIGIENKPWAGEGDGQLEAYYKHLKCKCEREDKKFCLVFITPNRRKPTSIDNSDDLIGKGELCLLSYSSDILDWIEECGQLCESDRFRWFLHDFRDYIRDEFPPPFTIKANEEADKWKMRISEKDIIIEYALENEENLAMVLDITLSREKAQTKKEKIINEHACKNSDMTQIIKSAGQEIRQRIVKTFLQEFRVFIQDKLDMSQWSYEEKDDPFQQKHRTIFILSKKAWQERYGIGLRGRYGAVNVAIGVHKAGKNTPSIEDLKSELDEKFETGTSKPFWVWLPEDYLSCWDYNEWKTDVLINMYTNVDPVVNNIGEYLLEIIGVAEPVIDKWIE